MPTQITFPITGPWNMTKYFSWNADTTYGDIVTASPTYTGWVGVTRIELSSDIDADYVYDSGSGYTYYRPVDKARNFTVNVDFNMAQIDILQWMTTLPNYGTPAATLAETRSFVIARKLAKVATMTEYFQILRNCVPTALELNLVSGQIANGRCTLAPRLISTPTDTNPLTTPTIPAAGSLSTAIFRPVDAGTGAITLATVAHAVDTMNIRWNYGWAMNRLWGSELLDAVALGTLTVSGTMTIKTGKDVLQRAKVESGSMASNMMAAKAAMKTAVGFINFTNLTLNRLGESLEFGSANETKETFEFNAQSATITAS